MGKKEELSQLFDKWQAEKQYQTFFHDGILDFEVWESINPKIMFLLKEATGNYNINQQIDIECGTKNSPFWWNIARWKYVIKEFYQSPNNAPILPSKEELKIMQGKGDGSIDDISYVNIKKNNEGKSTSTNADINKYAKDESTKIYLKREIEIIDPHIIFCGGTFQFYNTIYNNEAKNIVRLSHVMHKHNNRLIINFYHPGYAQAKGGFTGLFNYLVSSFEEINPFENFNWS